MCHGVLGIDGVTLERGPVKFVVLEADVMTGEKYNVPFNSVA